MVAVRQRHHRRMRRCQRMGDFIAADDVLIVGHNNENDNLFHYI